MQAIKIALVAATLGAVGIAAAPADAKPHKVRVCKTHWVNHHKVQRCNWVWRR